MLLHCCTVRRIADADTPFRLKMVKTTTGTFGRASSPGEGGWVGRVGDGTHAHNRHGAHSPPPNLPDPTVLSSEYHDAYYGFSLCNRLLVDAPKGPQGALWRPLLRPAQDHVLVPVEGAPRQAQRASRLFAF